MSLSLVVAASTLVLSSAKSVFSSARAGNVSGAAGAGLLMREQHAPEDGGGNGLVQASHGVVSRCRRSEVRYRKDIFLRIIRRGRVRLHPINRDSGYFVRLPNGRRSGRGRVQSRRREVPVSPDRESGRPMVQSENWPPAYLL